MSTTTEQPVSVSDAKPASSDLQDSGSIGVGSPSRSAGSKESRGGSPKGAVEASESTPKKRRKVNHGQTGGPLWIAWMLC